MGPSLTVIIPTFNESSNISSTVSAVLTRASRPPQVLVVDGGSSDATASLARAAGARVLCVPGGRAAQLNAGGAAAQGDTLFFLHADTRPPDAFDVALRETLRAPLPRRWWGGARVMPVAGAFRLKLDGDGWKMRAVEKVVGWRSRWLRLPYGDQGLFLSKDVFEKVGGFPDMPFMEDYAMVRKLGAVGSVVVSEKSVVSSARRWETLGVVKTSIINQCIVFGYHVGVPVPMLANWYRGALKKAASRSKRPNR